MIKLSNRCGQEKESGQFDVMYTTITMITMITITIKNIRKCQTCIKITLRRMRSFSNV